MSGPLDKKPGDGPDAVDPLDPGDPAVDEGNKSTAGEATVSAEKADGVPTTTATLPKPSRPVRSRASRARSSRRSRFQLTAPVARWWAKRPWWQQLIVGAAFVAAAAIIPSGLEPKWQAVLFYPVGVFVLLALGLNIVVGQAGMLDLGYVAFFAVGAYTTAKLTVDPAAGGMGLEPWLALPAGIALAMLAGVILGGPTLRLRGDYLAIVTLGFGEIIRIIALNTGSLGEARGIPNIPHPSSAAGLEFQSRPLPYYQLALAGIVVAAIVLVRLRRSRVGRAWSAIREDEDAAELMGVPTFKMKLWSFAMGASTGGMAGWIYATKVSFINPDNFRLDLSILILAAVVLGGMGSIPGVIVGAFAVGFIPEYLRNIAFEDQALDFLNKVVGGNAGSINEFRVFLFGFALVVMMIFRPQGILPSRQRTAELSDATADRGLAVQPVHEGDGDDIENGNVNGSRVDVEDGGNSAPGNSHAKIGDTDGPEVIDDDPMRIDPVMPGLEKLPADDPPAGERDGSGDRAEGTTVLELDAVAMAFGGVQALDGVSISVAEGEIFGIIGPNGAGKTTVFNCITGVFQPTGGTIRLRGKAIVGQRPHRITKRGIARTFQNIRLFPDLTAVDNVRVGADAQHRTSVPGALVGVPRHWREERRGRVEARRLLDFVGIGARAESVARNLPYGDQRRLEIARAMATNPTVLLLDEPAAGMNPSEKRALIDLIRKIRNTGITVVLIEHDMGLVMGVCDRIAVLDFGQLIACGLPEAVQTDQRVIDAYLGVPTDA